MTKNDTLTAVRHDPGTAAQHAPEWATLLVILAGTFMITLDFFISN